MPKSPEFFGEPTARSRGKLEQFDRLESRGELANSLMHLVEEQLIGTPDSVHGTLVHMKQDGRLSDDEGMAKRLVEFREKLYGALHDGLGLSDSDWEAIETRHHQDLLDARSTGQVNRGG